MRWVKLACCICIGWISWSPCRSQEALKAPVLKIQTEYETGAGFLVGSRGDELFAVTAFHVIEEAEDIQVTFRNNQVTAASIEFTSRRQDLAVIRFQAPIGYSPPGSFALAKEALIAGATGIKVLGHPSGANWDLNPNMTCKATEYDASRDFFTLVPTGIAQGNSGGPVLNAQNELLGMVQEVNRVNAVCLHRSVLIRALDNWGIPTNLMTGIVESGVTPLNPELRLLLQEAETAYQNQRWTQALRAYRALDAQTPDSKYADRIQTCEQEMAKDQAYKRHVTAGQNALTLDEALTHYRNAQQARNTSEIRELIAKTAQKLRELNLTSSSSDTRLEGQRAYTDPLAGEFVWIEGGSFEMGSEEGYGDEKPIHPVQVSGFFMGKYEVTQAIWEKVMGTNPSRFKGCPQCPVESVSWEDVQDFIQKLNQQSRYTYRLPTEAEWEYAARGGNKSQGYAYAGSSQLEQVGWYVNNSGDKTHPVGQKQPNELGLCDLSGNVREWCQDWYGAYPSGPLKDPQGPDSGQRRVLRGGVWSDVASVCRVSYRYYGDPSLRLSNIGFRVARGGSR